MRGAFRRLSCLRRCACVCTLLVCVVARFCARGHFMDTLNDPYTLSYTHFCTFAFWVRFHVATCNLNFGLEILCLLQPINFLLHQPTQLFPILIVFRLVRASASAWRVNVSVHLRMNV